MTGRHEAAGASITGEAATLARQGLAEFLGTALLVAAVVGSGIAAQRLSPHDIGIELFENTVATAAALVAIICAVGPVSGAHLNPVITLVDRAFGGTRSVAATVYIAAQFAGAVAGAVVANTMFGLRAVALSSHHRATGPHFLGEAVATFGLVLVVFGAGRARRGASVPFAVAAYIAAAYWFTSSTSFANPAVTLARMLSNSFSGIAPSSVPGFVAFELVGGVLGAACLVVLYPGIRRRHDDVLLAHEHAA